jgi:hypothetical protein
VYLAVGGQDVFFMKPSDLVEYETVLQAKLEKAGRFFSPLQSTLGWFEMEEAMFAVITKMAEDHDDWLGPANLDGFENVVVHYPERLFTEYFIFEDQQYWLTAEPIVKIHRSINSRKEKPT